MMFAKFVKYCKHLTLLVEVFFDIFNRSRRLFRILIIDTIAVFMSITRETGDKGMEKRRDRHEIVAEILTIAIGGMIKTHIMYRAKLSYSQINEYLPLLVDKGFLENTNVLRMGQRTKIYKTTQKGLEFIESLKAIDKLWAKEDESTNESP